MSNTERIAFLRGIAVGASIGAAACIVGYLTTRSSLRVGGGGSNAGLDESGVRDLEPAEPIARQQISTTVAVSAEHARNEPSSDGFAWVVLWDFENVTPPLNVSGNHIVQRLRTLLSDYRGCSVPDPIFRIVALCDVNRMQVCMQNELQASGVNVCHVPRRGRKEASDKAMLVELGLVMRHHAPPFGISLITGDSDFAYGLAMARNLGYLTAVFAPSARQSSPFLTNTAHKVWSFPRDVLATPNKSGQRGSNADAKTNVQDENANVGPEATNANLVQLTTNEKEPAMTTLENAAFDSGFGPEYAEVELLRDEMKEMKNEAAVIQKQLKTCGKSLMRVETQMLRIQKLPLQAKAPNRQDLCDPQEDDYGPISRTETPEDKNAGVPKLVEQEVAVEGTPSVVRSANIAASRACLLTQTSEARRQCTTYPLTPYMVLALSSLVILACACSLLMLKQSQVIRIPNCVHDFVLAVTSHGHAMIHYASLRFGTIGRYAIIAPFLRLSFAIGLLFWYLKKRRWVPAQETGVLASLESGNDATARWMRAAQGDVIGPSGGNMSYSGDQNAAATLPRRQHIQHVPRRRKPRAAISTLQNPVHL